MAKIACMVSEGQLFSYDNLSRHFFPIIADILSGPNFLTTDSHGSTRIPDLGRKTQFLQEETKDTEGFDRINRMDRIPEPRGQMAAKDAENAKWGFL
jgi:hypothetical protein